MKIIPTLAAFLAFALSTSMLSAADTYTITSKDGRSLEIKDPFFDGKLLKAIRMADGRTIRIKPEVLTVESWEALNADLTANMGVSFQVKPLSLKKDGDITWKTDYGSYEGTFNVERSFTVSVSSVNYFKKQIAVCMYFVDGDDQLKVKKITHTLTRNTPFQYSGQVEGEQYVLKLAALGITYAEGDNVTNTDYVVILEHADGSIADSYATNKSALDAVERYYASR